MLVSQGRALREQASLTRNWFLAPASYRGNPDRSWTTASSVKVKVLTADDLDKYTLADVVLPLPGYDIKYPEGPLFEKYKEIMAADGLDPSKMRRDQR